MNKSEELNRPSPRLSANLFSELFYCWLIPFFWYGKQNNIEQSDLYDTLPKYRSEQLADRLEKFWNTEIAKAKKNNRKPSLLKAIIKDFGPTFALYALFITSDFFTRTMQPLIAKYLISYFEKNSSISKTEAYIYFIANIICTFVYLLAQNKLQRDMRNMGMRLRIACSSLIYRKTLRLSQSSSQLTSSGKIINLLSNDVTKFDHCLTHIQHLWAVPVQIIIISYIMYSLIGLAALAGVFTLIVLSLPLQLFLGKIMGYLRRKVAISADERISLMSEIIHGIRMIKMYTWEGPFERIISTLRSYESKAITRAVYINSVLFALFTFAQRVSLFIAILVSVYYEIHMSTALVFTLLQYFNLAHLSLNCFYLRAITSNAIALTSIKRIQDFLLSDEMGVKKIHSNSFEDESLKNLTVKSNSPSGNNKIISIEEVSASWTQNENSLCIKNLNITVDPGKLYVISGSVGAGKSSLLKLLLQEIKPLQGKVKIYGSFSYASQKPWLFCGSIRDNVVFSTPYDSEKYKTVTRACALFEDFLQLPSGDKTLVGDNGENLSGGQRARINLARALYRDTDIYLLDDPLSAVDTNVCRRIYEMCIKGLLKNKTCLLVTHNLQCMKEADEIILLNEGKVEFQGVYSNLENNQELLKLIISHDSKEVLSIDESDQIRNSNLSIHSRSSKEIEYSETSKLMIVEKEEEVLQSMENLKEIEEAKATKIIPCGLYLSYFNSGNFHSFLVLILAFFIVAQLLYSSSDYYLAYWIYVKEERIILDSDKYAGFGIMGLFLIGVVCISVIKLILFGKMFVNASNNIHKKMTSCLLRATINFFDNNNSGRILNRFSKDLGVIDEMLPSMFFETFNDGFIMLGVLIQVIIIDWRVLFPTIILAYIIRKGQVYVLSIIQDLRRIEGNAKSPVLAHTKSSISGIITIRSSNASKMVAKQFDLHQDTHTSAFSMTDDCLMFLCWFADITTIIFLLVATLIFLVFKNDNVPNAMIGLAICQILSVCGCLQKLLRFAAEISMQMVSVERLFQYTNLEQESSLNQRPPDWWPSEGKIEFNKLSLKYSTMGEQVLKDLNFSIEPGTKVGIVGRTGAGKSSLIAAMFRFAYLDGSIMIDKIDTQKMGLSDLRKKISILPQEPILFSLSLKENLDPNQRINDDVLWSVLTSVGLKNVFSSLDDKLNINNLSSGQRQLLCLARTILNKNKNKIIIFDEATANIDDTTDALIQKIIKNKCKDCTVLTIAHRLNTIIDSDKILVIDAGKVVEYDHPYILLRNKNGYFSKMVLQSTDDKTSEALKNIAKENFKNNLSIRTVY